MVVGGEEPEEGFLFLWGVVVFAPPGESGAGGCELGFDALDGAARVEGFAGGVGG